MADRWRERNVWYPGRPVRNALREVTTAQGNEAVHRLVDYATVYPDGRVVFTFRNGAEVSTEI